MPLSDEQKWKIRDHVLQHAVPKVKCILEDGGMVPDDMSDEEAFADVGAVLNSVSKEIAALRRPFVPKPTGGATFEVDGHVHGV